MKLHNAILSQYNFKFKNRSTSDFETFIDTKNVGKSILSIEVLFKRILGEFLWGKVDDSKVHTEERRPQNFAKSPPYF